MNWDTPEIISRNSKTDDNLRLIIKEARNEQLTQEREIKERSTNLIIHVVAEMRESDSPRTEDEVFAKSLLEAIDVKVNYKSIRRLGKPDINPKRPIKLIMNNENDQIMKNLNKLKNADERLKKISVTDDYTGDERHLIKTSVQKANTKNCEEEDNSKFVWKVRGSPKNGLRLVKFTRRQPPQ